MAKHKIGDKVTFYPFGKGRSGISEAHADNTNGNGYKVTAKLVGCFIEVENCSVFDTDGAFFFNESLEADSE